MASALLGRHSACKSSPPSNAPCYNPPLAKHFKRLRFVPLNSPRAAVHCNLKNSSSVVVTPNSAENFKSSSASSISSSPPKIAIPTQTPNSVSLSSSAIDLSPDISQMDSITETFIYDEEKNLSGRTSFNEALLNSVNILLGVGLLSIPYALKQGGWGALGVLILLGIVTNYTGKLLGRIQSRCCLLRSQRTKENFKPVQGLESYEDIGEAAFGFLGRQFITFILYTELVGTCGLFFILEGDNFSRLFGGDPKFYMILSALFFLPTTWLPDLSALAALGALGALASSSVLVVLVLSYFSEGFPVGTGHELIDIQNLPLTFGLLSFVYAGHAVFPNIQSSMKQPELYPKMLDYTYAIVASVCALVGIIGYQMYGSEVMEEIILNLPQGALAVGATALIVVNPFTKFALTMEPVARGVENLLSNFSFGSDVSPKLKPKSNPPIELLKNNNGSIQIVKNKKLNPVLRICSRTGLGLSALFLATSVPAFASVMALIGSCLTMLVSVIFPSAAYLTISGNGISRTEKLWNYFIIFTGCICAITGTYTALLSIGSGHTPIL